MDPAEKVFEQEKKADVADESKLAVEGQEQKMAHFNGTEKMVSPNRDSSVIGLRITFPAAEAYGYYQEELYLFGQGLWLYRSVF